MTTLVADPDGSPGIYVELASAVEALRVRAHDPELRGRVERYLGQAVPFPFRGGAGRACLARQVVSPTLELFRFLELADRSGLPPLCLSYEADRIVLENVSKRSLCEIQIAGPRGDGSVPGPRRIVDFRRAAGRRFDETRTLWGEPLVRFHAKALRALAPTAADRAFDMSDWLACCGGGAKTTAYARFLALFVCHGLLFENYLTDPGDRGSAGMRREAAFTERVVIPSIRSVVDAVGVPPLIVRLIPPAASTEPDWDYYPPEMMRILPPP
ncbi:hypothetical protein [Aquisphaera insulae]|uniref:hypothetical protein n=1 Tax=Aquisphaera insulae TaxID=2712864 RepID=UPI0013EAA6A4|nr:hypothetical protein [Aquisphaera insulae]